MSPEADLLWAMLKVVWNAPKNSGRANKNRMSPKFVRRLKNFAGPGGPKNSLSVQKFGEHPKMFGRPARFF